MKVLFDETEQHNDKSNELDAQVYSVLRPIIDKWISDGYSIRQIQLVVFSAASDAVLAAILDRSVI